MTATANEATRWVGGQRVVNVTGTDMNVLRHALAWLIERERQAARSQESASTFAIDLDLDSATRALFVRALDLFIAESLYRDKPPPPTSIAVALRHKLREDNA